jgi:hypothetical protein
VQSTVVLSLVIQLPPAKQLSEPASLVDFASCSLWNQCWLAVISIDVNQLTASLSAAE